MYPYIIQSSVTDINWNGKQLWIDDLEQGRYMAPEILSDCFVERFIMLLSKYNLCDFQPDQSGDGGRDRGIKSQCGA